jgi:hypothetical protein
MMVQNIFYFALLAASAIASPLSYESTLETKQLSKRTFLDDTIKDVLKDVVTRTDSLTAAVRQFSGKVEDAAPILDASSGLQSSIKNGTAIIQNADTLSLTEVLVILPNVLSLNTAVEGVSTALIRKKPSFDAAGLSPIVLQQLQDQQSAAQSLVNVLITKLPPYLPTGLGEILSKPSLEALADAIAVFKRAPRSSTRAP